MKIFMKIFIIKIEIFQKIIDFFQKQSFNQLNHAISA